MTHYGASGRCTHGQMIGSCGLCHTWNRPSPRVPVAINGVPAVWSNEKQSWVPCWEPVETRGPETPREVTSAIERGLDNLHAYDCWDDGHDDHSGCIEIVRAVLGIPRPKCPVPCDDDCPELCHEAHNVRRKREHEPDDCPALTGGSAPEPDSASVPSAEASPSAAPVCRGVRPMPENPPRYEGFMWAWSKHENAPRTPCPTCHFESSEGYPESHAPDCPTSGNAPRREVPDA